MAANKIAGGAAAATGTAALNNIPDENAKKIAAAQIRTTAAAATRPTALRPHASKPTRTIGSTDGNHAVGDAHGPIAQYAISGHQVRDGGGNNFDTRHHRLEGGGEKIPASGDRRTDDNNSISNSVRSSLAGKHRGSANRSDRPARTVECYRQSMIDVGRNRSFIQYQTIRLDRGLLSDGQGGNAERKRHLDPVACSK